LSARILAALAAAFGTAMGSPAAADIVPDTPPSVAQVIAAERLPSNAVSFTVIDLESRRTLLAHNADTPRSPASTIKLVTTFAALDSLGPAYTWHTQALVRGALREGVLDGDLILKGGGDPYMTLERWWSFVSALRARGLKSIRGNIILDDTAFALTPEDPAAFDGRPHRAYNAEPDALMVNFQSIEFRVAPNREAHAIDVVATPAPSNLIVENHIAYAPGRCRASASRVDFEVPSAEWDRVVFKGSLSGECAERDITRVLLKAPSYAFGTFVSLWRQSGGEFSGAPRIEASPADAVPLLSFDSLTLGEIARLTNKFSNNLMARHLLLTLGADRFGAPATLDKAGRALDEWARSRGLALPSLVIDNGSGLSRTTRISVREMAAVLQNAYRSRYAPEFMASLPLAGIDGTLRTRLQNTAAGSVRLKTGHLDGVSGIAGYVANPAGKRYVLVCLVNDPRSDSGAAEPVHEALVNWIQAAL
jgi:D-alanyl-D-alanine carboxypeptidase/D-alanyl-D-alanine-endopeptidase (penicillin-binding protein 4)